MGHTFIENEVSISWKLSVANDFSDRSVDLCLPSRSMLEFYPVILYKSGAYCYNHCELMCVISL